MKHLLTLILLLCLLLTAFGQQVLPDSGFTNKAEAKNLMVDGKKEGKWCEYMTDIFHPTKDLKIAAYYRLVVYKDGVPIGVMREYYKDGRLFRITPYVNGQIDGMQIDYYPEETVYYPYKDGKVNGLSKQYYCGQQGNGLKWENTYVNDTIVGIEKGYYENGKLRIETPYVKGKKNGIEKYYYNTGELAGENPYVNGKENGVEKSFYTTGELMSETPYTNGKAMATKRYDKNGNIQKRR